MAQNQRTHEYRIRSLEKTVDDHYGFIDHLGDRVGRLEYWRDGNGAQGAEHRLQQVESHYMSRERTEELISHAVERSTRSVMDELRRRGGNRADRVISLLSAVSALAAAVIMAISLGG